MKTLFIDKTGTLTEGTFEVQRIDTVNGFDRGELLMMAASLEQQSSHPIADAILGSINGQSLPEVYEQQERAGQGLKGMVGDRQVLAGNRDLLTQHQV